MNYCVVYWSRFGHNKKIVEYLEKSLKQNNHTVQVFSTDEADPSSLPNVDRYVFSAPAEAFRLQKNMRVFMKRIKGLDGKKFGIINTHGMKKKNWLQSMEKLLLKKNMVKLGEMDFIIGEGQKTGEGLSDNWMEKIDEFIEMIQ